MAAEVFCYAFLYWPKLCWRERPRQVEISLLSKKTALGRAELHAIHQVFYDTSSPVCRGRIFLVGRGSRVDWFEAFDVCLEVKLALPHRSIRVEKIKFVRVSSD